MIREKVKNLWRLCFNDDEEYIDLYFDQRYNNDVNVAIQSSEQVIAAMQMLPYPMTFEGKEINTAYISGACTHPDFRNRGVMSELLSQGFAQMLRTDVSLATLIPAEQWLFNYYARNGFATVFHHRRYLFTASVATFSPGNPVLKVTSVYKQEIYDYLNKKLRERPNCIQHTQKDFLFVLSDMQLSHGHVYTLNREGNIIALAIAYPTENNGWYIGEIVFDTPEISSLLLQRICEKLKIPGIEVFTLPVANGTNQPLGMARIINAKNILQLYAAAHPELELNIFLSDEQISANNGYYHLNKGKCINSAKRLPGNHLALTIGELTEKIVGPLNPSMSLMAN